MRILAAFGRSARMSLAESADVVIEMDAVNGELGPDFAALECPTVFVAGTGAHSGATEDEMRTVRAAVADAQESNKRVSVFATTPHKHTQILKQGPRHRGHRDRGRHPRVFLTGVRPPDASSREDGGLHGWGAIRSKAYRAAPTYRIERHLAALLVTPSGNDGQRGGGHFSGSATTRRSDCRFSPKRPVWITACRRAATAETRQRPSTSARFWFVAIGAVLTRLLLQALGRPKQNSPIRSR